LSWAKAVKTSVSAWSMAEMIVVLPYNVHRLTQQACSCC